MSAFFPQGGKSILTHLLRYGTIAVDNHSSIYRWLASAAAPVVNIAVIFFLFCSFVLAVSANTDKCVVCRGKEHQNQSEPIDLIKIGRSFCE